MIIAEMEIIRDSKYILEGEQRTYVLNVVEPSQEAGQRRPW